MRANRRRDTAPELAVRRELHRRGLRYRVDFRVIPQVRSRADVVFTARRIAVYIDGCFWHQCPVHGTMPAKNRDYWEPKLARNRERDQDANASLAAAGWTVLRFWEHQTAEEIADIIEGVVRRAAPEPS